MIKDIPQNIFKINMNFDVKEIHQTTIRILEELGIPIGSIKCLEFMESIGCEVDYKKFIVKIPEYLIEKSLQGIENTYKLYNRNGDSWVNYGGNNILLTSGAAAIRIREFDGTYRDACLKDLENFTKLHDYFDAIDIIHTTVDATDIPQSIMRTEMAATVFKNTKKPCWFVASNPEAVSGIYKMAVAIRGSEKDLESKPFFRIGAASNAVLGFQKDELELLMRCAELGIPAGCEHYPIMGLTAPLSISGALSITNANYLCAHVIKTNIDPDNQSVYPVMAGSFNMKNGEIITSSPEIWQYYIAGIKLGQLYGIPTFILASSDSKNVDIQAIYEKAMAYFISASAGVNNIFAATNDLDSMNLASYEQVVIDLEVLSSLSHFLKGFSINTRDDDFKLISRCLNNKMYFLDDSHTLQNFKNFIWNSEIFIKDNFMSWKNSGMPEVKKNAYEKIEKILLTHEVQPLQSDVIKGIDNIVQEARYKRYNT